MSDGSTGFRLPDAYEQYMGRHARRLARAFVAAVGVQPGDRVLDVGCGTGALAAELARILGPDHVTGVDPSEPFAAACSSALPGVETVVAAAERLPFPDDSFDAALSQLVVNFMTDARAGVAEMRRVTRRGGRVAACTWDYREGMTILRAFWDAAVSVDPEAPDEGTMPLCAAVELATLWGAAGLEGVATGELSITSHFEDFDDYWEPFTLGVGPGGVYCASLRAEQREALAAACWERLGRPSGAFQLVARAWLVSGRVP